MYFELCGGSIPRPGDILAADLASLDLSHENISYFVPKDPPIATLLESSRLGYEGLQSRPPSTTVSKPTVLSLHTRVTDIQEWTGNMVIY